MSWSQDVQQGIRTARDLPRLVGNPQAGADSKKLTKIFKVRAPKSYIDLVNPSDPHDPIAAQFFPDERELRFLSGELPDPIGDKRWEKAPRLVHRYPDRVLLFPTFQCAVYCRYCFRKERINDEGEGFSKAAIASALSYIASQPELREVILSGGDPWTLSDRQLKQLRIELEKISHLRLLRVHTRVPVVLPRRVTSDLVDALRGRLMVCVVMHFNHPREITNDAIVACQRLREGGFMLLNQTVLLRGVNDDETTLKTLMQELVYSLGAKPYYLHHCDKTRGIGHFRTTIEHGTTLMRSLRGHISGVCVPNYMLDLPGGDGKVPLGPSYVERHSGQEWGFRTYDGKTHTYVEEPT
ncbi:MAG: KamA family radical SAM protein [Myxococcales bacterium]|nr:KamA family radical SAM protein [Myxococcales bacterium]